VQVRGTAAPLAPQKLAVQLLACDEGVPASHRTPLLTNTRGSTCTGGGPFTLLGDDDEDEVPLQTSRGGVVGSSGAAAGEAWACSEGGLPSRQLCA
jgi:hypothetical protein